MPLFLSPKARKLLISTHNFFLVSWVLLVSIFLALSIIGMTSSDPQIVTPIYISMWILTWFIVPANLGTLFTAFFQSIYTPSKLFYHKWLVVKLVLITSCMILILLNIGQIKFLAETSSDMINKEILILRFTITYKAGVVQLILIIITIISFYKTLGINFLEQGKINRRRSNRSQSFY